ncbi:hypothetical protein MXD61_03715 [Frankia sp. AgPm24]|uniref:hypothetical protein n=1 Tax=Frankia sp. AgPm24 TaxID=631128 RepID=UPI00200E3EAE|nr:hypothetical protein [Frankia sp. AgPm24]MCK9921021.1 hypothetical protein [Frankia sp. AgPm24]
MDVASINSRLSRAASAADSRELDGVCETVAAELVDAGVEPPFRIPSADFTVDPWLICADRYWRRRLLAEPTIETAARCARWLYDHTDPDDPAGPQPRAIRPAVIEKWTLGYAFITRDSVESRQDLSLATGRIVEQYQGSVDIAAFATLYHAGKLRANFAFDELRLFLDSSLLAVAAGQHRDDPLFTALRAFAALGSSTITIGHGLDLLDAAWTAPGRTRAVVDVCLNALWAAKRFPERGEWLRRQATEAVAAYPDDHLFHFRLARGHRLCGDYAAALSTIETALRLLPAIGSRISHNTLQEQYLREQESIEEGLLRAAETSEQRARWQRQAAADRDLRRTLSRSSIQAVELVTVFTAAIAFTVGSFPITLSGDLSLGARALLMGILGIGLLLFAVTIVAGTWYLTGQHHNGDDSPGRRREPRPGPDDDPDDS